MPKADVKALAACVQKCKEGDTACVNACETDFLNNGGTASSDTVEGGKVFTDPNGGKVFITNGGKVF